MVSPISSSDSVNNESHSAALSNKSDIPVGPLTGAETVQVDNNGLLQTATVRDIAQFSNASATYTPSVRPNITIPMSKVLDENTDLRTIFGLVNDPQADNTEAWNDLTAYINGLKDPGSVVLLRGTYRITGTHADFTNAVRLVGDGNTRSRLLFDGTNGLVFNLAGKVRVPAFPELIDLAITTTNTFNEGFSGVTVLPMDSTGKSIAFRASGVLLCSDGAFVSYPSQSIGNTWSQEWAVGFRLGDGSRNLTNTRIDQCYVRGAPLNAAFNTQTGSVGVLANTVTNLLMDTPTMDWLSTSVHVTGSSEGLITNGGRHVSVGTGFLFDGYGIPANNHYISNTHIAPHFRGIRMIDDNTVNQRSIWADNHFTNVYVLEKTAVNNLPKNPLAPNNEGFIGLELNSTNSRFTGCRVQANQSVSAVDQGDTLKIAMRIGRSGCQVNGLWSNQMHYVLDVPNYTNATDFNSGTTSTITDVRHQNTRYGFLYTNSNRPIGNWTGNFGGIPDTWDLNFTERIENYSQSTGAEWLRESPGQRLTPYSTTYSWDGKSSTSTAATDWRLIFQGGDTAGNTQNGGTILAQSKTMLWSATELSPQADGGGTVGSASRRVDTFYGKTGTINTSDARLKTEVQELSANELAAACALVRELGVFKFLDAVQAKGDGARLHAGMTVQRAMEVMTGSGLDPMAYGFICYDEWEAADAILDADGTVICEAIPAGNIYSFRESELHSFMLRGLYSILMDQEERLSALESR
ncbi:tail fiber domain-containing protein [Burkholderia anthina]|uniref:tail fiber domain-containing protein n=1 Tax=Burkholderia anthina TaxID=179879 RepID=UPI00158F34FE|nr:tail fiber domain-containing protein [Burkholderia anthina]